VTGPSTAVSQSVCLSQSVTGPRIAVSLSVTIQTACIVYSVTSGIVIVISELGKHSPDFQLALSHFGAFIAYSASSYGTRIAQSL
jgi:S-adenosylhomocysteine hydrolase